MDGLIIQPSYEMGNFATGPEDAEYPGLWEELFGLWSPSLGPTGLELPDSSGNGNPGALTNMVAADDWVVNEKGVYVLDYAGAAAFVNANVNQSIFSRMSVSAWILSNSYGAAFAGVVYGGNELSTTNRHHLELRMDAASHVQFGVSNDDTAHFASSSNVLVNGTGYFVVGTFDKLGSDNVKIYVDGVLRGTANFANTDATIFNFDIGYIQNNLFWPGRIGDVSIYNRAVTANEIAAMAAGASPLILKRRVLSFLPAVGLFDVRLLSATVTQPAITASVPQPTITASVPQPTLSSVTAKNDIT